MRSDFYGPHRGHLIIARGFNPVYWMSHKNILVIGPHRGHLFIVKCEYAKHDLGYDFRANHDGYEQVWPLATDRACRAIMFVAHSGSYEQMWPLATNVLDESLQPAHPAS